MLYDFSACADAHLLYHHLPPDALTPTTALLQGWTSSPFGWSRLSSDTAALIRAAPYVSLPFLSRPLLPEWIYRLSSLQDAGLVFSYFTTPDGPCPRPITSADLLRHLNARFSCAYLSNQAFDAQIRLIRHSRLANFHIPFSIPTSPTPST
jgi:hypothetical protein